MKRWFLPFVREGFRPSRDRTSDAVPWRAQARVTTRITSAGHQSSPDTPMNFELLGPGDVIGFDAAQVLRVVPSAGARNAEAEFFPAIELDAPDLPWAFSATTPQSNRVVPWMCLVVLEEQEGLTVQPGAQGQSPWILGMTPAIAAHELPELRDPWAWAHAQVTCDTQDQIGDTLENYPDRTLSRLLSPRRLLPFRRYLACVVPTTLAGRIAGLGGNPEEGAADIAGKAAWSAADLPAQLPAYFTWRFATGEAGDAESMIEKLHPAPLDPTAATRLRVRASDSDAGGVVTWQAPLKLSGAPAGEAPPPALITAIRDALAPSAGDLPVVGPAYLGEAWRPRRPLEPATDWTPELNLSPMWRAAAGLGAEIVRDAQEDLVAAAWIQVAEHQETVARERRVETGRVLENQVRARLASAPAEEASRVLGPVVVRAAPTADSIALRTGAGRRIGNRDWRRRAANLTAARARLAAVAPAAALAAAPGASVAAAARVAAATSAAAAVAAGGLVPIPDPPPLADPRLLDPEHGGPAGPAFAPSFPSPMGEVLARRFGDLLLPSKQQIGPDSLLWLDLEPRFVEAFLLGANQELNRELLWRGLPVDRQATPFRQFWSRLDGKPDILGISEWTPDSPLGGHRELGGSPATAGGGIVLRSELVRRCPGLQIGLLPAQWLDGKPVLSSDMTQLRTPTIRTLVGDDTLFIGFPSLTRDDIVGARRQEEGPAGWFLVIGENPMEPRFGLDPPMTPPPPLSRASLCWSHLNLRGGAYALATLFPSLSEPETGFEFSFRTANAASYAFLLQQLPFRVYLHGSVLASGS